MEAFNLDCHPKGNEADLVTRIQSAELTPEQRSTMTALIQGGLYFGIRAKKHGNSRGIDPMAKPDCQQTTKLIVERRLPENAAELAYDLTAYAFHEAYRHGSADDTPMEPFYNALQTRPSPMPEQPVL